MIYCQKNNRYEQNHSRIIFQLIFLTIMKMFTADFRKYIYVSFSKQDEAAVLGITENFEHFS